MTNVLVTAENKCTSVLNLVHLCTQFGSLVHHGAQYTKTLHLAYVTLLGSNTVHILLEHDIIVQFSVMINS